MRSDWWSCFCERIRGTFLRAGKPAPTPTQSTHFSSRCAGVSTLMRHAASAAHAHLERASVCANIGGGMRKSGRSFYAKHTRGADSRPGAWLSWRPRGVSEECAHAFIIFRNRSEPVRRDASGGAHLLHLRAFLVLGSMRIGSSGVAHRSRRHSGHCQLERVALFLVLR